MTQPSRDHPILRRVAIGAHAVLAAWLLINGIAHEISVLVKASAGTLHAGADVPRLLAVGAALAVAGAVIGWTTVPLARGAMLPPLLGAGLLGLVLGGIALAYGPRFLGGSIALGVIDVGFLTAWYLLGRAAARR